MAERDPDVMVAASNVDDALAAPVVIDEDELERARRDERWRDFCLNAEDYVSETTRRRPKVEQPA